MVIRPPSTDSTKMNEGEKVRPVMHQRYRSYETSGLHFEVKPTKNVFTITVEKP